jgi:hypothetical protein
MSEREHVNEKDFVRDTSNDRKGRVMEVKASHGQARVDRQLRNLGGPA